MIERVLQHDRSAFLSELHTAAAARRLHNDLIGELEINRAIIATEAGEIVDNEWTGPIARRFLKDP